MLSFNMKSNKTLLDQIDEFNKDVNYKMKMIIETNVKYRGTDELLKQLKKYEIP